MRREREAGVLSWWYECANMIGTDRLGGEFGEQSAQQTI